MTFGGVLNGVLVFRTGRGGGTTTGRREGIGWTSCDWCGGGAFRREDTGWTSSNWCGGGALRREDTGKDLCAALLLRSSVPAIGATTFFVLVGVVFALVFVGCFFLLGMILLGSGLGDPGWYPLVFAMEENWMNGVRAVSEVNWSCNCHHKTLKGAVNEKTMR